GNAVGLVVVHASHTATRRGAGRSGSRGDRQGLWSGVPPAFHSPGPCRRLVWPSGYAADGGSFGATRAAPLSTAAHALRTLKRQGAFYGNARLLRSFPKGDCFSSLQALVP